MRVSVQKSAIVATPTGIARLNSHRLAALHTETARWTPQWFRGPAARSYSEPTKGPLLPGARSASSILAVGALDVISRMVLGRVSFVLFQACRCADKAGNSNGSLALLPLSTPRWELICTMQENQL